MRTLRSFVTQGLRRETAGQSRSRLLDVAGAIYQIIEVKKGASSNGAGMNGSGSAATASVTDGSKIAMTPPIASKPPVVTLPVSETAKTRAIRAWLMAGLLAAKQDIDKKRTQLSGKRAAAAALLLTRRARTRVAKDRLDRASQARDRFRETRTPEEARTLDQPVSRVAQLLAWAVWLADTWIIARAWGLYGPAPVPFAQPSVGLTEFTSLARAGLVSFGLIFGVRLVASKARVLVERFRARAPLLAGVVDGAVVVVVLVAAVRLALATAVLQSVLLKLEGGGSNTTVPVSVLVSIVTFLISVSFASGYFGSDPNREQARAHDKNVHKHEDRHLDALERENAQKGRLRTVRENLQGLDRHEQLLVDEQEQHIEHAVMEHKNLNPYVYGPDQTDTPDTIAATEKTTKSSPTPRRSRRVRP